MWPSAVLTGDRINEGFFMCLVWKCMAVPPGQKKVAVYSHITRWPWDEVPLYRPIRLTQCCTQFKTSGNKKFCFRNFHIINLECHFIMQIQYTKNLNPGSDLNWVQRWVCRIGLLIYPLRKKRLRAWYRRLNPRWCTQIMSSYSWIFV